MAQLARCLVVALLFPTRVVMAAPPTLEMVDASKFAKLALKNIRREFPNKPEHVLNAPADALTPRALHPAFYGCYDWHSSVHGHWMLVRLMRTFPDLPEREAIQAVLMEHLSHKNIRAETAYFRAPNRQSFERMYGWAWLLKLSEELESWDHPDAKKWAANLRPLAQLITERYIAFLPKQTYPIRTGVHPNTAFGLAFALDYARTTRQPELRQSIERRTRDYFAGDVDVPASWEPGGADFFSPSLMEADLMRRVLEPDEFVAWFHRFLPGAARGEPKSLMEPAIVTDRSDPQLVHLDGLNLSRAWCMKGVARRLPNSDPAYKPLLASADRHAAAALPHVTSNDYAGEHWLASFAVYLLSKSPEK